MTTTASIYDTCFVIAQPGAPSIIDIYSVREGAERYLPAMRERYAKDYDNLQVMSYPEYMAQKRKAMLSEPLVEISQDDWMEALEVLPPDKWHTDSNGVNKFLMCEHYTGSFTTQYAKYRGRCFSRMVDSEDESTWITLKEIADFAAKQTA